MKREGKRETEKEAQRERGREGGRRGKGVKTQVRRKIPSSQSWKA